MKQEHVFTGIVLVLVFALIGMAWYVGSLKREAASNNNGANPSVQDDQTNPATNGGEISFRPIDSTDYVRGAAKPRITIIEYSDTECPFCIRFHQTLTDVLNAYPSDVAWVYRFSPIPQLHPKATAQAIAAHCVGKLNGVNAFWKYLDRIFETTPGNNGLDQNKLDEFAAELGVNAKNFDACRTDESSAARIASDVADARRAGLQGTPYSIVVNADGKVIGTIPGYVTYAQLKPKIDAWVKTANQ